MIAALLVTGPFAGGARSEAGPLDLLGALSVRGLVVEGQRSWLDGGFGRLSEGAGEPNDALPAIRGQLHAGFDWTPAETWLLHAHGAAWGEPSDYGGRRAGRVHAPT